MRQLDSESLRMLHEEDHHHVTEPGCRFCEREELVTRAGRFITAAESAVGELPRGMQVDLLLDQIEDIPDSTEAAKIVDEWRARCG